MHLNKIVLAALLALWAMPVVAQSAYVSMGPSLSVPLPARPYAAIASTDGSKIFVSTQNTPAPGGLALVEFKDGKYAVTKSIPLTVQPAGLALSHDGKLLIAPGADGIAFVDTEKFAVLGTLDDGGKGPIMAKVSADDKTLFVSDEMANRITVIDLAKARATGFKPDSIIATIDTGRQPVGLALSSDGRFLYTAVEISKTGDTPCKDAARAGAAEAPPFPEGTLTIIDVTKRSVIAELPSGCRPIRVVVSSDGKRAYVSARGSNEIVAFDTEKKTRLAAIKLPAAAFGIALSANDRTLFASTGQTLSLIDTASLKITDTTMPTSGSARDMSRQAVKVGSLLLLTNGGASTLEIFSTEDVNVTGGVLPASSR